VTKGWVKIHRELLDSPVWADETARQVWLVLLMLANHKARTWQGVHVRVGQVIMGRRRLYKIMHPKARYNDNKARNLWRAVKRLESAKCVQYTGVTLSGKRVKSARRASLITILNWETYQCETQQDVQLDCDSTEKNVSDVSTNKNVFNKNTPTVSHGGDGGEEEPKKWDTPFHRMKERIARWCWPDITLTPADWARTAKATKVLMDAGVDESELGDLLAVYWPNAEPSPTGLSKNVSSLRRMIKHPEYRSISG
jgi:hypothetical protein